MSKPRTLQELATTQLSPNDVIWRTAKTSLYGTPMYTTVYKDNEEVEYFYFPKNTDKRLYLFALTRDKDYKECKFRLDKPKDSCTPFVWNTNFSVKNN